MLSESDSKNTKAQSGRPITIAMGYQEFEEQKVQYLRAIFDTFPHPSFIVDEDVQIQDFNTAAEQFLGPEPASALYRRGGEVFHCIHSFAQGCGKVDVCKDCLIRNSVQKALHGEGTHRELHEAEIRTEAGRKRVDLLVTAGLLPYAQPPQVLLILEDLTKLPRRRKPQKTRRTPWQLRVTLPNELTAT